MLDKALVLPLPLNLTNVKTPLCTSKFNAYSSCSKIDVGEDVAGNEKEEDVSNSVDSSRVEVIIDFVATYK